MATKVLCLLTDGFEEIETLAPVDLLCRAGAEVVLASVVARFLVKGRCGIVVQADRLLEAGAEVEGFAALLIPGGPGVRHLRTDGRAAQLAHQFARQGKVIAAICAAPTVLADAGLLAGRRFTAHFSVHNELPGALADERVVEDGPIITSRGAGTAMDFGLALVRRLFGEEKAAEIATAIML